MLFKVPKSATFFSAEEPGLYWPLEGKAHTTCKAVAVALTAGVDRHAQEAWRAALQLGRD